MGGFGEADQGDDVTDVATPPLVGNPLLVAHDEWLCTGSAAVRTVAISQYAFAVPTEDALSAIAGHAGDGVVELGAGTGYWARMLVDRGVDVVAYDAVPPPSAENPFFAGVLPWFPIRRGDEHTVAAHADRTLLLVWPTRETWATNALRLFRDAGGQRLVFVGEGPGGRMGDEQLHALLGLATGCVACEYGVVDAPCVCSVRQAWRLVRHIGLPHWGGYEDDLYLFERL